ncbi:MFS general substrate transporter [Pseudovirgaria hyperparasitica]|uniref:Autophagy-related protein n=1 Tax=Pseudovirgaria hyperparasitica TaxID=470096 RepID=A0A6A6WFD5_9PEZI|nr:MFS general substrate transporter [Pseudovirgaria hyperparasitica]KAF2760700.1 MFS general substrate transporter [Pseudovirgaria hyperparasitica]
MPPNAPSPEPTSAYLQLPTSPNSKRLSRSPSSFISSSYSADDEHSSLEDHTMPAVARYEGEDTRLTSRKELAGFYMYGWAAEVFVVCGVGSFIPITLEQLARENGVLLSDRKTPCGAAKSTLPPATFSQSPRHESAQCIINIMGTEINTASFAMYTFSLSVLVQALLIISMSGAADHGHYRKTFLLVFAFIGSIATMLFITIIPRLYLLAAVLAIVANTCFGASFVLLNSFLPVLVRNHPTVQYAGAHVDEPLIDEDGLLTREGSIIVDAQVSNSMCDDESFFEGLADSTSLLVGGATSAVDLTVPNPITRSTDSVELRLSTKISSYGIGIGYIAAVIVQVLAVFIVQIVGPKSTISLQLALFLIGAWWFLFTFPTAFWLRPRPGPPLGRDFATSREAFVAYFTYSWSSLGKTARKARKLKDVVLFLTAWFLLSDSIATVGGTAVLFAKTSLEMTSTALALISVIGTLSGVIGAFTWTKLSSLLSLRPTQTIILCLCIFLLIPLYGLLSYIPVIQRLGVLGLQQDWEMYPVGAVYGFALGGFSSYCRSLFGELIPPGYEAAFYALYAITDKGSSIFGPAVVGAITDATGEIRPAFFFLAAMIASTFPFILLVDVQRGRRDGSAMANELLNKGEDERWSTYVGNSDRNETDSQSQPYVDYGTLSNDES